jgi:hypothetical protein
MCYSGELARNDGVCWRLDDVEADSREVADFLLREEARRILSKNNIPVCRVRFLTWIKDDDDSVNYPPIYDE